MPKDVHPLASLKMEKVDLHLLFIASYLSCSHACRITGILSDSPRWPRLYITLKVLPFSLIKPFPLIIIADGVSRVLSSS